jgi:hypothetical protein
MTIPGSVRTAAAVLLLAIAVTASAARTWHDRVDPQDPWQPRHGFCDFRDGVYFPTLAFVSGGNPIDAATYLRTYPVSDRAAPYSPLMYLLHAPLTLLPFTASAVLYFALSAAVTVGLGAITLSWAGVPLTAARIAGIGALLILSRPGLVNLFNGQVTLIAVSATYLALWYAHTRPVLAGAALAVSTFKPTYGLPLAVLLALRADRRVVALGLVIACVVTLPAVARIAVASGGVVPMVDAVRDAYVTRQTVPRKRPENSPFRIDAIAFAGRTLGRSLGTVETLGIMAGILLAAGAALRRLRPGIERARRLHGASIAALATVAAFYHQSYDGLALVLPLVVLLARPDLEPWRSHPGWRWTALVCLAVPFVNYAATDSAAARFGQPVLLAASSVNGLAILLAFAAHVRLAWRVP